MAEPRPDRVDINTGTKQVGRSRVTNRKWANTLGLQGWDLFRRSFRVAHHKGMNSKARHGVAVSVEEQWPAWISTSDETMQFGHRLFPERTKPNFPAFAMNLHGTGSCRVPS